MQSPAELGHAVTTDRILPVDPKHTVLVGIEPTGFAVVAAFEAPAVVTGLDDVTVVGQAVEQSSSWRRRRHDRTRSCPPAAQSGSATAACCSHEPIRGRREAPSQSWSTRTTVYPDNFRSARTLPRCPTASTGLGGRRDPDLVPFDDDGRNLQVALDLEVILRLNELVDRVDAILTSDVPAGGEKLEV
jgi:hypothetical protein